MRELVVAAQGRKACAQAAAEHLHQGELVAFVTDTVYGLGARLDDSAIEAIYAVKNRPKDKALALLAPSVEAVRALTLSWPHQAQALAQAYWPGALTLILSAAPSVPLSARAGLPTVGVRIPNHPSALAMLRAFGGPLAVPSANPSELPPPTHPDQVRHYFANEARIAALLDDGPCPKGVPSTIVDLSGDEPKILRHGALTEAEIWRCMEASK